MSRLLSRFLDAIKMTERTIQKEYRSKAVYWSGYESAQAFDLMYVLTAR